LIISVWDVWRYYSIGIVLLMKLGLLMTSNFVPGGELGSICFFIILIAALFSGRFIEHAGHLH